MFRQNKRSGPPRNRTPLLLLTPIMAAILASGAADAATPKVKITAKGAMDPTTGQLRVDGAVTGLAKTDQEGKQVAVFDAATNQIIYATKTNSKGKFTLLAPADKASLCKIKIEAAGSIQTFPVKGAATTCSSVPTCAIDGGDRSIKVGDPLTLNTLASKAAKNDPMSFEWRISNTGPSVKADASTTPTTIGASLTGQSFKYPGLYHIALYGENKEGSCQDSITVSVAPANAPTTVDLLAAAAKSTTPAEGSAVKAGEGSYVVLPFEDTGMQGGSQISLPYNPMIPYNSLNAQVIQKKPHRPPVVAGDNSGANADAVKVFYSAGINSKDPVGSDSINSTSQNWFGAGKVGSNIDYAQTKDDNGIAPNPTPAPGKYPSQNPISNVFIAGQDFINAEIRKTEQWDRMYQKNAAARNPTVTNVPQTGYDNASKQNSFTPAKPLARPDEGIRGYLDNGAEARAMPGIGKAYETNNPQSTVYSSDQSAFIAQFIPASNVDDKGRTNPFPVMRLEAKIGTASKASTDAVFTTASETRCRECHLPGGIAANGDVWRTPVSEYELAADADNNGIPDQPSPASGNGSYDPGLAGFEGRAWPPAIHNHFDDRHPDRASHTNLFTGALDIVDQTTNTKYASGVVARDKNDRRTDRVTESRWIKVDANGNPNGTTSDVRPTQYDVKPTIPAPKDAANPTPAELEAIRVAIADAAIKSDKAAYADGWRIQLKLKFKDATAYGDKDDPIAQEKAALFNTMLMHDYMVFYGPTPSQGKDWPASYSSMLTDNYSDDDLGKAAAQPQYFCSGHHQSQFKFDVGIGAKSPATNRSDYSRAFHAFHGKMQTYKTDVSAGADGLAHKKGELIRDGRGHPLMYGGRGWDSQQDDDNGIPLKIHNPDATHTGYWFDDNSGLKGTDPHNWEPWSYTGSKDANGNPTVDTTKFTKFSVPTWDPAKNNWRPDLFGMHKDGQLMLPFGKNVAMDDNCVTCHTGKTEKSYRDIHHAAGLKCDACHGDMLAVGNVFPNDGFDQNLTWAGAMGKDSANGYGSDHVANLLKSEPNDFRRPWLDEPDCGSCHFGNANGVAMAMGGSSMLKQPSKHVFSAGVLNQAWDDGDKTAKSKMPMDARFAVMPHMEQRPEKYTYSNADVSAWQAAHVTPVPSGSPTPTPVPAPFKAGDTTYAPQPLSQALYRKSGDVHGTKPDGSSVLTCSTCHGGSHAIWPNPDPNANDNVTAKQLQGYAGNISECTVCHVKGDFNTGLVATDGGASGLGVAQGKRDNSKTDLIKPDFNQADKKSFLAGPHGMHPVNDESWWKNVPSSDGTIHVDDFASKTGNGGWHSEMTYKPGPDGEDQCAACHGKDHKGTRLSKTLTARDFVTDKGKKIHVEANTVIGCNLCHKLEVSFSKKMKSKNLKDGVTWPDPKQHMPDMPMAIEPVPAGSMGGGH